MAKTELLEHGRILRGYLGVFLHAVPPPDKKVMAGALVDYVVPDSPAAAAGIRPGDIVTHFDGSMFRDLQELRRRIAGTKDRETVEVRVLRDGEEQTCHAEIRFQPSSPPMLPGELEWGLQLASLTPELAAQLRLPPEGVLVAWVHPQQAGGAARLRPGDVIDTINDAPALTLAEYAERVARLISEKKRVQLGIRSRWGRRTVELIPATAASDE